MFNSSFVCYFFDNQNKKQIIFTRVKISQLLFSLRHRGLRHRQQLVNPVAVLRRNLSQGRMNAGMLRNFCLVDETSAHEGVEVVARVLLLIHAVKKAGRGQNAAFGEANVRWISWFWKDTFKASFRIFFYKSMRLKSNLIKNGGKYIIFKCFLHWLGKS